MQTTMKNRDVFPVGTRVRPAHDRMTDRVGTVIGHATEGRMTVEWDGQGTADGFAPCAFMPGEIRAG